MNHYTGESMDIENIKKNWTTYTNILGRFNDKNIIAMLEKLGERLCVAPSNYNNQNYGCHPGGLVLNSIKIAMTMQSLNEFHKQPCDVKSVYKIGLLHELGRLGTSTKDWLIPQDSDWHREKLGNEFKINFDLPKMSQFQRTVLLLNEYQIKLTEEEFMSMASLEDLVPKNKLGAILLHARNMLQD